MPFENTVLAYLHSLGIPAGRNPYSETEDSRRADYDIWALSPEGLWLEAKKDWESERSGNICFELASLDHTKAHYFVYGLPYYDLTRRSKLTYIHAFSREEVYNLFALTKLTYSGRFYLYSRIQIGDQPDNRGILVPRSITKTVGLPLWQICKELMKQAA